ncbi:hypothetical protein C8Q70DRAFT_908972 [Cubamyces menziesii]|uniref:Methyltransferase ausD n=1 Tax=Trametes cubensis TaxID=1111947 RepID=A0AAD7TYD0_9APHY|nr:hypothetical protein C8Q70DRAFT_908972 [Cubamyces menziesii]KAJ8488696.1 hypothetical protein ONZ51_g3378 [Trametes cubensis]
MPGEASATERRAEEWRSSNLAKLFPIDVTKYSLKGEELEFMQTQTGIKDEEELKKHILAVQAEAYSVFPYPCIRRFAFLDFRIGRLHGYDQLLKLGRERKDAVFLDIGCCFGNDIRYAAKGGFPVNRIIASDLHAEYWELGHKLFRSTQESFPVKFIAGDVFDSSHVAIVPPIYTPASEPVPDLSGLTSLNPLHGHVSAIHASAFFHLFDEAKQEHIARALAGLLSAEPGSMILGTHGSAPTKGPKSFSFGLDAEDTHTMFCHSPESWKELWDGQVFKKGSVNVETRLIEVEGLGQHRFFFLEWCVTRL